MENVFDGNTFFSLKKPIDRRNAGNKENAAQRNIGKMYRRQHGSSLAALSMSKRKHCIMILERINNAFSKIGLIWV
jgi:hypothetical protein